MFFLPAKLPKQINVLTAVDWLDGRDGNARHDQLVQVFVGRLEYESAALQSVLGELETQRLIQTDGNTYRGHHYSLTWPAKQKVRAHRIRTGTDMKLAPEAWKEHGGDFFSEEDVAEMLCLAVPVPRAAAAKAA